MHEFRAVCGSRSARIERIRDLQVAPSTLSNASTSGKIYELSRILLRQLISHFSAKVTIPAVICQCKHPLVSQLARSRDGVFLPKCVAPLEARRPRLPRFRRQGPTSHKH
jgi:hypothetical protein